VEPQPKHAITFKPSVLCCHLANTNEEFGGLAAVIPFFCQITLVLVLLLPLLETKVTNYLNEATAV